MLSTIEATEARLTDVVVALTATARGDALDGDEGVFLLDTFWLAEALAMAGRPRRARAVFERAVVFVNDVGLLAEEVDPTTGELLGNFPQAFSHIGLINAAWAICEAEGSWPLAGDLGSRQWPAAQPPSTCSVSPVTNSASSR